MEELSTLSNRGFWQVVFLAAIDQGKDVFSTIDTANLAIKRQPEEDPSNAPTK